MRTQLFLELALAINAGIAIRAGSQSAAARSDAISTEGYF
jgi:hypothetical protein